MTSWQFAILLGAIFLAPHVGKDGSSVGFGLAQIIAGLFLLILEILKGAKIV